MVANNEQHELQLRVARRSYSASAQAVEEEHYEPAYNTYPPQPQAGPSRPRSQRQGVRRDLCTPPAWASLPASIAEGIENGIISTPGQFSTEFERLQCKSGQLADTKTLQSVFRMYLRSAEPSQWAWLSGQLGHMLAAVADAGTGTFHPDVSHLGNTIRAYCLAELRQTDEASGILHSGNPERLGVAVDHAIWSLALRRIGDLEGARGQMVKALRRGLTVHGHFLTPAFVDCFASYAETATDDDMLYIMRKSSHALRRILLNHEQHGKHHAFLEIWHDWLSDLPVSLANSEPSTHGRFLRRYLLSRLNLDPSRAPDAYALFQHMQSTGELGGLTSRIASAFVRCLVQGGMKDEAESALTELRTVLRMEQGRLVGLFRMYVSDAEKEGERAEMVWQAMEADGRVPSETDRLAIARLRAAKCDLAGVQAALSYEMAGMDEASAIVQRRLRVLLRAAIAAKDIDAATEYMLSIAAVRPGHKALASVLQLATRSSEPGTAQAVLHAYINAGHTPSREAYTILITHHAHRRELDSAKAVYDDMRKRGVELDAVAWSALLNAHVEAGDWEGVAERYTLIPEAHRGAPTIAATMMKALVLKGSPIAPVLDMFRSVETPTTHHWALALQSACDNGDLRLMERLYAEMQARAQQLHASDSDSGNDVNIGIDGEGTRPRTTAVQPDVYVFSVMLHAYLKANKPERSREVYDEMLRLGIVPSSVTYSMIISSYASGTHTQSLKRAQDTAFSIYRLASTLSDNKHKGAQASSVENILSPLIRGAGRAGRPEDATKYFEMVKQDAEPSIPLYSRYLDVWRRAGEPNMVMRVWAELFALACRTISFSPITTSSRQRQRQPDNTLVIPLSIVLITLGRDRRLLDIRRVWEEVRTAGFGFDASNFNHLAVALGESGDVEGAFDVVENVLLESANSPGELESAGIAAASAMGGARARVSSRPSDEDATEAMFRPPNRRDESIAALTSTGGGAVQGMSVAENLSTPIRDDVWQPYYRTLVTLDSLVSQLESGQDRRAWMGLATTEEDESADTESSSGSGHVVSLPHYGTFVRDPVDGQPKKTSARGLLMKLNRKYSKAMALVMFHRRKQGGRRRRAK